MAMLNNQRVNIFWKNGLPEIRRIAYDEQVMTMADYGY